MSLSFPPNSNSQLISSQNSLIPKKRNSDPFSIQNKKKQTKITNFTDKKKPNLKTNLHTSTTLTAEAALPPKAHTINTNVSSIEHSSPKPFRRQSTSTFTPDYGLPNVAEASQNVSPNGKTITLRRTNETLVINLREVLGAGAENTAYEGTLTKDNTRLQVAVIKGELETLISSRYQTASLGIYRVHDTQETYSVFVKGIAPHTAAYSLLNCNVDDGYKNLFLLKHFIPVARSLYGLHLTGHVHQDTKPLNMIFYGLFLGSVIDQNHLPLIGEPHRLSTIDYSSPDRRTLSSSTASDTYGFGRSLQDVLDIISPLSNQLQRLVDMCTDETRSNRPTMPSIIASLEECIRKLEKKLQDRDTPEQFNKNVSDLEQYYLQQHPFLDNGPALQLNNFF